MISEYFTLNTSVEIICFIVAFFCLIKDKSPAWKSMILFLLITCVTELIGIYIKKLYLADTVHVRPNVWIYNVLIIFQAGFTSFMFSHLLNKYINSKPIILGGLAVLFILYVVEVYVHGVFEKHNITTTSMSVWFVLLSLFYFYQLHKDAGYIDLKFSPAFWWVSGILFFYFGRTACNLFYYKLSLVVVTPKHYLTYYIYNTLNILLYACWSYAFICRKWLTTTSKNLY
ncbi:hypothetical protein HDF24_24885 [Mucilaginibacter sp. X4EP1]|uniref:hypothetical protein n=1 Tax=Mucilaginibacter sp. X4EP1 TaxID=2723092 RepID=UPI00216A880F|nr:hypothetical protein [Mucilaginibacter sp. X4EP1]MCS3815154.1 hypothetical protein [Mucilaginibacter sp. X4EP1]